MLKRLLSALLFLIVFSVGLLLSLHKPLWNDELYTQTQGLEKFSYLKILRGQLKEGNNYPLFYLIQKGFNDAQRYRFPLSWDDREIELAEPRSQALLRIPSNIFMSLSLTIVFAFFYNTVGPWAGIYALALGLATPTVWLYWAEERPYALWFLLTTIQSLLLLAKAQRRDQAKNFLAWLAGTNILLALTASVGTLQASLAGFVLFLSGEKRIKAHLGLTLLPIAAGAFFFFRGPHFAFGLPETLSLVLRNIPAERLALLTLAAIFLGASQIRQKYRGLDGQNAFHPQFLFFVALIGLATIAILLFYRFFVPPGAEGFILTERHFIYLAPLGVIATTAALSHVCAFLKNKPWAVLNVILLAAGFLGVEMIQTAAWIIPRKIFS